MFYTTEHRIVLIQPLTCVWG